MRKFVSLHKLTPSHIATLTMAPMIILIYPIMIHALYLNILRLNSILIINWISEYLERPYLDNEFFVLLKEFYQGLRHLFKILLKRLVNFGGVIAHVRYMVTWVLNARFPIRTKSKIQIQYLSPTKFHSFLMSIKLPVPLQFMIQRFDKSYNKAHPLDVFPAHKMAKEVLSKLDPLMARRFLLIHKIESLNYKIRSIIKKKTR